MTNISAPRLVELEQYANSGLAYHAEEIPKRAEWAAVIAELHEAQATIERVKALHHPDPMAPQWCVCEERVPCSTLEALEKP